MSEDINSPTLLTVILSFSEHVKIALRLLSSSIVNGVSSETCCFFISALFVSRDANFIAFTYPFTFLNFASFV